MTAGLPPAKVVGVAHLQIWMETDDPPTGRVAAAEGQPAQPFVGWLQLLTILAHALEPRAASALRDSSESAP